MKTEWIAFSFFFLAALVHFGFFIFESFLLQKSQTAKRMSLTSEAHKAIKPWAFNQGFYNLFLALGTFTGLYMIFQKKIMTAGVLVSFCGLSMIGAGIALWFSIPRLRKFALLQLALPLIGFVFLFFHVRSSL